jgi:hypothetical protein
MFSDIKTFELEWSFLGVCICPMIKGVNNKISALLVYLVVGKLRDYMVKKFFISNAGRVIGI